MDCNGHVNHGYGGRTTSPSTTSIPGEYRLSGASIATIFVGSSINLNNTNAKKDDSSKEKPSNDDGGAVRQQWGKDIEFLMSCIALSVGLGNVWRFPFTALDNGGGAFVIPYLIVLFLVGKPVYYMEMLLGQFSSRGCVNVFDFSPIMRGVGYGQAMGTAIVTTYYATLMALTVRYFIDSFHSILPWSYCRDDWTSGCVDSTMRGSNTTNSTDESQRFTSAEYYFRNIILCEKDSLDDGIGWPNLSLALCLAFAWICIALIMIKGVQSSGKASYFLALFPYTIMLILFVRSITLPGALNGVAFFITPQWDKLLDPKVWYAAVTQVFFSLAICFGNIIMYASYNRFGHNIYKDVTIVTTLDTCTSLLSGVIIFGILGNLAYELDTNDIKSVVKGGTGLAFISYPDAIAKFTFMPQIFALLFFLMLFVLGIGCNMGMASCVVTVIKDKFTNAKHWIVVLIVTVCAYLIGLVYITPGGQFILNLVDFYGASFVALVLAIFELLAVGWIYGVKRFCQDIQFMLGIQTSAYYRICWAIITPALMATILIYTLITYQPLQYNGQIYPNGYYVFGWCLWSFGVLQLVFWGIYAIYRQPTGPLLMRIRGAFKPMSDWGPLNTKLQKEYKSFVDDSSVKSLFSPTGFWQKFHDNIFG